MAVKTITITMEAYDLLKAEKREHESFSNVITRTHKKPKGSILDLCNIFTLEQANEIERHIMKAREDNIRISAIRGKEIAEALNAARHDRSS